jgi:hypothetical protein
MPQNKFETLWNNAKTTFGQQSEGRKKPSEKALGFFRKSSGLAKAATGLDKALAGIEPEALQKSAVAALAAFRAAKTAYLRTLTTALEREAESPAYRTACRNLETTLNQMPGIFESTYNTKIREVLDKKLTDLLRKGVLDKASLERANEWLADNKFASKKLVAMIHNGTLPMGKDLEILKASFKAAKQELLAFETNVVPMVSRYCQMFGVTKVEKLPSSPEVSGPASQLYGMYWYYIDFTKGQGPRIQSLIDEWEEAKSKLTAKKVAAFEKAGGVLMEVSKLKAIQEAQGRALGLINDRDRGVNNVIEPVVDKLLPHLADLREHAKKIDVDFKPIDTLVANLKKQQKSGFDGTKTTGYDVLEWFGNTSKGMRNALKPFKSI